MNLKARKQLGEVNFIIRNGVIKKRQPRMQTIPQPILQKSLTSSPAIMGSIPDTDQSNGETEVDIDYNNCYPAHDCTKLMRSLDVPNTKVNKENCFPGNPIPNAVVINCQSVLAKKMSLWNFIEHEYPDNICDQILENQPLCHI